MIQVSRLLKWFGLLAIAGLVVALLSPASAIAATQSFSFVPSADAYVVQTSPTSHYGSNTSLLVDKAPLTRAYIRFKVSGLNSNPITKAILMIYANSSLSAGFNVNALSNNTWTESAIDYDNAPAPGAVIGRSGSVTSGRWVSIDVTSYVLKEGTYNFVLTPNSVTRLNLASREAGSKAPKLVITSSTSAAPTPTRTAIPNATPTLTKTAIPNATQTQSPTTAPTQGSTTTPTQGSTAAPTSGPSATATPPVDPGGSGQVPAFSHIIVLIFENKEYTSIIGKSTLPNFNGLANQYALLTKSYAPTHPSLPNYLALTSGSTQGITSDCTTCYLNATNIADSIEASGRTWKAYMESMPSPCYVGNSGKYAQKHNPFIYYNDIRQTGDRCKASVVPLTQLDTDLKNNSLPNYVWITPNLCNSGHDCSIATADKFLGAEVNKIITSSSFDQNSLLIVTFDEGSTNTSGGGHIVTILISPLVQSGFKDATTYNHYSILKTIEQSWGLPFLGRSADAASITAPWK